MLLPGPHACEVTQVEILRQNTSYYLHTVRAMNYDNNHALTTNAIHVHSEVTRDNI